MLVINDEISSYSLSSIFNHSLRPSAISLRFCTNKFAFTSITIKTLEVNQASQDDAIEATGGGDKKNLEVDLEEDEGIDDDDDEEKALVENEPEPNNDDDNTLDTSTNPNTTENTTTTIINDSDPASQWKEERWHQENDDTSKRSSDTSIISHQSGGGSGTKVLIVSQDEIIVEINGTNENSSDIEMDANGDSLQDDDEDDEANSEEKLLKCNNNNELVAVKIHSDVKSLHNGVGVNGFEEICLKINQLGW